MVLYFRHIHMYLLWSKDYGISKWYFLKYWVKGFSFNWNLKLFWKFQLRMAYTSIIQIDIIRKNVYHISMIYYKLDYESSYTKSTHARIPVAFKPQILPCRPFKIIILYSLWFVVHNFDTTFFSSPILADLSFSFIPRVLCVCV